jgi:hypothetical protein
VNLKNIKSLHWQEPSNPIIEDSGNVRKRKCSPNQEFELRHQISKVEKLPNDLAAVMMKEIRTVEVQKNGIKFDFQGESYLYWHPDSTTCDPANLGKKVTFVFDRDSMEVIYILDRGAYVETIPQKNKVQWFSKETEVEIATHQRVISHVHTQIKKAHGKDTEALYSRIKSNAEKIQTVHTMTPLVEPSDATSRFPKADSIIGATSAFQTQKTVEKRHKKRIQAERGDLSSLEPQNKKQIRIESDDISQSLNQL